MEKDTKIKALILRAGETEMRNFVSLIEIHETLHELYALIDTDVVEYCSASVGGFPYNFIVDDEGTFKEDGITAAITKDKSFGLVRNVIITSATRTKDGYSISMTDYEIENILQHIYPVVFENLQKSFVLMLDNNES